VHAGSWRLDPNQVKSAILNLEKANGEEIEIIPVREEEGISVIAFALKECVAQWGTNTQEVAIDSTCKWVP
jgi:hypothetical protein